MSMRSELRPVYSNVLNGDMGGAGESVQAALDAGLEAEVILKEGLVPAMTEVGRLFEEGEYYVPEMLIAARAMQNGLELIKPMLLEANVQLLGKVAIGTVKGDLHDIGKNLVGMMLEGAGFEIRDLGVDVTAEQFVDAVKNKAIDIVAMSALLTTTMPQMQVTIDALVAAGLRDRVKVMVGGAPITEDYANGIGADGFAQDAGRAASLAKLLLA
jgi:5-methyltetrahydrofolate--homocysteine methyltransferase